MNKKAILMALLCTWGGGLAAQETATVQVEVPPAEVRIIHADTTYVIQNDSAVSAAFEAGVASLHAALSATAQAEAGTDWYGYAKDAAWIGLAIWGIIEFRKYRKHRTNVNVDVDVDVEPYPTGDPGTDGLDGEPGTPGTPGTPGEGWVPPGHRKDRPGRGRGRRPGGEE